MNDEEDVFTFGDGDLVHDRYDQDCEACWTKPLNCDRDGCRGLVHTAFGDEGHDGYWLYYCCDICGPQ